MNSQRRGEDLCIPSCINLLCDFCLLFKLPKHQSYLYIKYSVHYYVLYNKNPVIFMTCILVNSLYRINPQETSAILVIIGMWIIWLSIKICHFSSTRCYCPKLPLSNHLRHRVQNTGGRSIWCRNTQPPLQLKLLNNLFKVIQQVEKKNQDSVPGWPRYTLS